jgi:hypothetical protein
LSKDEKKAVHDAVSRAQSWFLTPKGLQIQFDPYNFGGYASGAAFTVPWAALKPVLRDDAGIGD